MEDEITQEIIEALESTAVARKSGFTEPGIADKRDIRLWRDRLMRFLDELDGELTVDEIRQALESWE